MTTGIAAASYRTVTRRLPVYAQDGFPQMVSAFEGNKAVTSPWGGIK